MRTAITSSVKLCKGAANVPHINYKVAHYFCTEINIQHSKFKCTNFYKQCKRKCFGNCRKCLKTIYTQQHKHNLRLQPYNCTLVKCTIFQRKQATMRTCEIQSVNAQYQFQKQSLQFTDIQKNFQSSKLLQVSIGKCVVGTTERHFARVQSRKQNDLH